MVKSKSRTSCSTYKAADSWLIKVSMLTSSLKLQILPLPGLVDKLDTRPSTRVDLPNAVRYVSIVVLHLTNAKSTFSFRFEHTSVPEPERVVSLGVDKLCSFLDTKISVRTEGTISICAFGQLELISDMICRSIRWALKNLKKMSTFISLAARFTTCDSCS